MRLDKFFTHTGTMSRKECAQAAKRGRISVGGKVVTDSAVHINENTDTVTLDGAVVTYMKYIYMSMTLLAIKLENIGVKR